jgi:ATP-dependent Clp protease ATP-binding subunit ClpA
MFERFSKGARSTVATAVEEAERIPSDRIGVEHLLLGLLRHAPPELAAALTSTGLTMGLLEQRLAAAAAGEPLGEGDAEALRSIGIDLDAVTRSVDASFGPDALGRAAGQERRHTAAGGLLAGLGHIPFNTEAKKTLELSLREAIAHHDKTIGEAHIALGILRAPGSTIDLLGGKSAIGTLRVNIEALLRRTA